MQRILGVALIFLCFLSGCGRDLSPEFTPQPIVPIPKQIIVIDAGHGGKDPGSQSRKYEYEEKALTLATARLVADYLRDLGYLVVMTREGDSFIPLHERAEIANQQKADLFVSIHYNYCSNREVEGIEIYYYKEKQKELEMRQKASIELGKTVLARLIKHTQAESRGVKAGNFAVIRETKMPAILIEGGFLSNPSELKRVKDPKYRHYLAYGIARGIDAYLCGK